MTNGRRRGRGIGGDQQEISPFVTDKPIAETIPRRGRDGYLRSQNVQISQGLLQLFEHILKFPDAFPADDTFLAHSADGLLAWLPAAAISGSVDWTQIINKPSTIGGYSIQDAYTKTQIQAIINAIDFSDTGFGNPIAGVAARSQLPVQIAYEDEVNVFSEANSFGGAVTMSSTLGVTDSITVGNSTTGDDGLLLYFDISRAWRFEQYNVDGPGCQLMLRQEHDLKEFHIGAHDGSKIWSFIPSSTPAAGMVRSFVPVDFNLTLNVDGATTLGSTLGVTGITTLSAALYLIDANLKLERDTSLKITTASGYVRVGPLNTSWCHFITDRASYYMDKALTVVGAVTLSSTLNVTGHSTLDTLSSDAITITSSATTGLLLENARKIRHACVDKIGGWVTGVEFSDLTNTTVFAGFQLYGSGAAVNRLAMAFGATPYSSGTGLYVHASGGVSILTTTELGALNVDGDVTIGSLGTFDSADTPTDRQLLLYNNSVSKWQAEDIQLAWGNSDVKAAVLADNTAVTFIFDDPGAGADSPVGAPPIPSAPTLYGAHESITLEVVGYSPPADFRYFEWRYSDDNFVADDNALATTTSDKIVHARLDNATTYYYKVRATDRAGNSSSYSSVSNTAPVANASQAFGIILAAEIGVANLAAIQANIGIITAGQMRDSTNVYGINLGGAGGIPVGWAAGINFENTAVDGMDRYVNFYEGASDGLDFFIKHEHFDLMHDGTARFRGFLDLTALGAVYGLSDQWAVFRAPDLTHGMTDVVPTDVALDVLLQSTTQGGVTVRGLTGTGSDTVIPLVLFGISGRPSPVTSSVHIYGRKKNGTTTQALADDEPILRVSSIALTSDIAFEVFPKRADFPAEMSCTGEQTFSSTGTQNNVSLDDSVSVFIFTGGSGTTITGFSGGYQGRLVYVVGAGAPLTIANNSGSSSLGNRVYTGTGASVVFSTQGGFFMRYDGTYWRILALSN